MGRAAGVEVAIEGKLAFSQSAYLKTDVLWPGTMVEIVDASADMHALFDGIKAAGRDWDGRDPVRALG